jgi:hypothetical protein
VQSKGSAAAINFCNYLMLVTKAGLLDTLWVGRGLFGVLQMALIDQLDLAILATISFGFGFLFGIPFGYGIRPRHHRIR